MKRTLEILTKLIAFDTTSSNSNLELIEYIKTFLTTLNIKNEVIYNDKKDKANIFATIGKSNQGGIVLSGHTDIVPTANQIWHSNPYTLTTKEKKLFGRGTADMKGFIACCLALAEKIHNKELSKPIHLAFSYDEELGCLGVCRMLDLIKNRDIKPEFCIVGEPTSMNLVTAHKGNTAFKVLCRGQEAHSSLSPLYQNAIYLALDFINELRDMQKTIEKDGFRDNDFDIPFSTIHTGTIKGGTARNIVPNLCEFNFEIRHIAQDDVNSYINHIFELAKNLTRTGEAKYGCAAIEIEKLFSYPGLNYNFFDNDIFSFAKENTQSTGNSKVAYGTEAGFFYETLKIPTIILGPGNIEQAHKPDEYIELEQLEKCFFFLNDLAFKYLNCK
ncbi:MAG: acetylornithine deacetylase [Alphaproteobacteria bacterium]